jgi:hypothetical protein
MLYVSEYVQIALESGLTTSLLSTPTARRAGWWANHASSAWSDDGKSVILPEAFPPEPSSIEPRPCVAVLRLSPKRTPECVEVFRRNLPESFESGYENIASVAFAPGRNNAVVVGYMRRNTTNAIEEGTKMFVRSESGGWVLESGSAKMTAPVLNIEVRMSYREPPVLMATDTESGRSRLIWDPNPQLRGIELGEPSLYRWNDSKGREWHAILYKPNNYVAGQRYPLVIQNHGYNESVFDPSEFPSAFVAQELAAVGIVVLQMQDCAGRGTPTEGPCNVMGYESAVEHLASDGLIDPNLVGLNGFSRTVYYVMEALTTGNLHFKAASITDGIDLGYFQHILTSGWEPDDREDIAMIGAEPYGPGLRSWTDKSPEFNLDKIKTPLRIVGLGLESTESMWEPFALLRSMQKPVEFVFLNTKEHIVTNPVVRLAAQGGNVDWFRFWLQSYEDPAPSKAEQYKRWRLMRSQQVTSDR